MKLKIKQISKDDTILYQVIDLNFDEEIGTFAYLEDAESFARMKEKNYSTPDDLDENFL
ncbi:hypothetical protein ACNQKP_13300 [Bdellovibrio bacteriovorus]|uniref:hypothetical protein n=1 Tax=Bdellovibrio bacteriovorus TaxID=959 RepID=UPI003AA8444C